MLVSVSSFAVQFYNELLLVWPRLEVTWRSHSPADMKLRNRESARARGDSVWRTNSDSDWTSSSASAPPTRQSERREWTPRARLSPIPRPESGLPDRFFFLDSSRRGRWIRRSETISQRNNTDRGERTFQSVLRDVMEERHRRWSLHTHRKRKRCVDFCFAEWARARGNEQTRAHRLETLVLACARG